MVQGPIISWVQNSQALYICELEKVFLSFRMILTSVYFFKKYLPDRGLRNGARHDGNCCPVFLFPIQRSRCWHRRELHGHSSFGCPGRALLLSPGTVETLFKANYSSGFPRRSPSCGGVNSSIQWISNDPPPVFCHTKIHLCQCRCGRTTILSEPRCFGSARRTPFEPPSVAGARSLFPCLAAVGRIFIQLRVADNTSSGISSSHVRLQDAEAFLKFWLKAKPRHIELTIYYKLIYHFLANIIIVQGSSADLFTDSKYSVSRNDQTNEKKYQTEKKATCDGS
jgi:hypothetical protein